MINDILISVVAPVCNEEKCIREYINQTIGILQDNYLNYELILVDDGSTDNSVDIIKEILGKVKNIRLIVLSRNFGHEVAISAGLDMSNGDYVVLMDSDLQDPPYLIPKLIDRVLSGYDVVYAARISRAGESFFKKISSKYFYKIASRLSGFTVPDDAGDFRVFNRKVVNSILELKESNRYMKMLYAYVGFKVSKIPFDRHARYAGTSKYSYVKLFNASLDAIISFSSRPLRIVSIFSTVLSLLLFALTLFIFIKKMMYPNSAVEGWASTMVFISLMFAVLFIFLSIISEYISRILNETKNRPLYYVREEHNSAVMYDKNIVDDL